MPGNRLTRLVGTALRTQRELHRLTQQELADRAGTSQATVARIERGGRVPSLPMLEILFAALDAQLAVTVEPLDAHLDARMADIGSRSIVDRLADTDIHRVTDALSPREPGDLRWETVAGEIHATMSDELPLAIEVRHGKRIYRAVPLADVEVADPRTADLLRRYRDRHGRSAD